MYLMINCIGYIADSKNKKDDTTDGSVWHAFSWIHAGKSFVLKQTWI